MKRLPPLTRADIEADLQQFLAAGRKIQIIPMGVSGDDRVILTKRQKKRASILDPKPPAKNGAQRQREFRARAKQTPEEMHAKALERKRKSRAKGVANLRRT